MFLASQQMAASAGESVSALNSEMAMEKAMVSENCLYRIPVVPGKNDTGTKTEISTSEVAMTALETSAMATDVAVWGSVRPRDMPLRILDYDDGVIDHQSCGQRDSEQGQRVDGEAEIS